MKKIIHFIKLGESVGRLLMGNQTEKDKQAINTQWTDDNVSKKSILNDFSDENYLNHRLSLFSTIDIEAAWNNFLSRLANRNNKNQGWSRSRKILSGIGAASISAAIILGVIFFTYKKTQSPFGEKAHLILSQFVPGKTTASLRIGVIMPDITFDGDSHGSDTSQTVTIAVDSENYPQLAAKYTSNKYRYNKLIVPIGNEFYFVLPDGSEIWMNSDSEITYFPTNDVEERIIYLEKGEAYFKVAPDPKRPFKVYCSGSAIEALGTEFNIAAYNDSQMIYTTLAKGSIKLSVGEKDTGVVEIMSNPGRQCVLNRDDNSISLRDVNLHTYTGWKNGFFVFDRTSLFNVMKSLSRWYDFDFDITDPLLYDYHFTGEFNRFENLEQVFEVIRSTDIPFSLDFEHGKVIIRKSTK